jgi:outer membrane receptor protein involved in Fe transport
MRRIRTYGWLLPVLGAAGATTATTALAQQGSASGALEEVTVTAQRRAESINDVGLSIVAISGDELINRGVTSPADLVKFVPGLTYTDTPYGTGVLTLRGVGFYESSMAASSPVALYIDEIPLPYPRMALGTALDVERVEVLKGPQGTLYGVNSTGGLVNFIANKPTDAFAAGGTASFGRFEETSFDGFLSGPLGDGVAARVAVGARNAGEWQRSATRDDEIGGSEVLTARALLDWRVGNAKLEFNVNGFKDTSDTQAAQATGLFPGVPPARPIEQAALLIPPGDNRLADWDAGQPFEKDNSFYQASLKATIPAGSLGDLISITSYQKYRQDQYVDADGTNIETAGATQEGDIKSLGQELRVQGERGAVKYVFGGNYSDDSIYDNTVFRVRDSSLALTVPVLPIDQARTYSDQDATTWAVFVNADYAFTDRWSLQAGARYTQQDREFTGCIGDNGDGKWARLFSAAYQTTITPGACTTFNPFTGVIGPVSDTLDEDNTSWRAALNFKATPDALLYGSVSRGYKAGSFPTVGGVLSVQYEPAVQETVLATEFGTKLTLADRRVQLDAAVFHYDYTDKQFRGKIVDQFFGSIEKLYNVPESSVFGAELSVVAAVSEDLRLNAAVAYSDSNIDSDFPGLTPIGTPTNLQDETFEFTPRVAAVAGFEYQHAAGGAMQWFVGIDAKYQSDSHAGYGGLELFELPSYTLLDARFGLRSSDGRWSGQLWGRNLTDEYYVTNANYLGDFTYRLTGRPRTYGVSVTLRH